MQSIENSPEDKSWLLGTTDALLVREPLLDGALAGKGSEVIVSASTELVLSLATATVECFVEIDGLLSAPADLTVVFGAAVTEEEATVSPFGLLVLDLAPVRSVELDALLSLVDPFFGCDADAAVSEEEANVSPLGVLVFDLATAEGSVELDVLLSSLVEPCIGCNAAVTEEEAIVSPLELSATVEP